jgi:hypothetical protein
MLCATGELDRRQCGPYVPTQNAPDGQVFAGEKVDGAMRRSIYLKHRRTEMPTLLGLFDTPVMVTNCTRRSASTVPLQSLALLNSEFVRARSRAFAARLEREAGPLGEKKLDDERIGMAFLLALGRGPSSAEREASWKFLKAQRELFAADPSAASSEWTDFCQMVLASNTFLYVD